jgi:hypothetical protein
MRAYLIDEISASDLDKIKNFLENHAIKSNLDQVFWVQIPDNLLTATQLEHRECRPHVFSVELGSSWVKIEFFIRSLSNMRCTCPGYCSPEQMSYIIAFSHSMIEQVGLRT